MTLIGCRCRGGNVYSRAILITRTLSGTQVPPNKQRQTSLKNAACKKSQTDTPACVILAVDFHRVLPRKSEIVREKEISGAFIVKFLVYLITPLARKNAEDKEISARLSKETERHSGGDSVRVPPLPIPNREVKPHHADDTAKVGK